MPSVSPNPAFFRVQAQALELFVDVSWVEDLQVHTIPDTAQNGASSKKLFTIKNTGLTVSRATAMQKDVGMPVTLRIWAKTGMVGRAL
jgi:hypothetical protein